MVDLDHRRAGRLTGHVRAGDDTWWADARCNDRSGRLTAIFFSGDPQDIARAKGICATCPALLPCLEGAIERREPWGVWGGSSSSTEGSWPSSGAGAGLGSCPGPRTSFRTSTCRSTSAVRRSPATPDTCAVAAHFVDVAVSTSSTALKIDAWCAWPPDTERNQR